MLLLHAKPNKLAGLAPRGAADAPACDGRLTDCEQRPGGRIPPLHCAWHRHRSATRGRRPVGFADGPAASRRKAEPFILDGRVTVNGEIVAELGSKADPDRDHIKVDGKLLRTPREFVYLAMNKPDNCVTTMHDPQAFLVHDIQFHRRVAAASKNPIVAALVEMVAALYYDRRRQTAERATGRNLHDAAELHRRIYRAIRARNAEQARSAMNEHLLASSVYQEEEEQAEQR